jgi:hypothetical protein
MTSNRVFLDSAYAMALAVPADQHHQNAKAFALDISRSATRMLTTRDVLVEVANAMSRFRYRAGAVTTLQAFEADPLIEIIERTPELYQAAFNLFAQRMDKEWSLTDCLSFVLMRQRGLTEALISDEHFQQAGFKALLRD